MPRKKEKRRKTLPRPRNFLVPIMRLSRKTGAHLDRKKEARRRACRGRLVFDSRLRLPWAKPSYGAFEELYRQEFPPPREILAGQSRPELLIVTVETRSTAA
jgi:hypothetical protein